MVYRLLFICLIFSSCAGSRMIETDLYFGQSRPDGSIISANEWDHFKSHQIAPLFKEGCTIVNTTGTWLDPVKNQLITEPTYVVIYFYKKSQKITKNFRKNRQSAIQLSASLSAAICIKNR